MAPIAIITKYSHHFVVTDFSESMRKTCMDFAYRQVAWTYKMEYGRSIRVMDRVYAASDARRTYFRFHINQFEEFIDFVTESRHVLSTIRINEAPLYTPGTYDIRLKPHWVEKEDQVEHIRYLINSPHPSRLLTRQTGTGKTFCSMAACAAIKKRVVVVVQAKYLSKWESDVREILDIEKKDVLRVKGGAELKMLIMLAKADQLTEKVILISIQLLQNWITLCEDIGQGSFDEGYECWPWEFFETIDAGVRVIDEVHSSFHQMFKLDLYTNAPCSISLSATLVSRDPLVSRMHNVMFPAKIRTKELALKKFVCAVATHYMFDKPEKVRTTQRGNKNYSHSAFEQSIMAHVPSMLNYFRLIKRLVDIGYITHPRKKKRLGVYCASVEMCTKLTDFLRKNYPGLDIRRYCDGDPYENAIEPDIRVTTIGSCGTAIDIPDLVSVIMTHNIDSIQSNIQALGRLRELKGGGTPEENATYYYYLVADNIQKHVAYAKSRKEVFAPRVLSMKEMMTGVII